MTFKEVALECIGAPDLVKEFNRLTESKLGIDTRAPIERMVDKATGYEPSAEAMRKFIIFVFDCIWIPLIVKEAQNRGELPEEKK